MKLKHIPVVMAILCAALLALTACAAREPKQHGVTFYDGGSVVGQSVVEHGSPVAETPDVGGRWEDAQGNTVDLSTLAVKEDSAFYLWRAPALRTTHGDLMPAEGSSFSPDQTMTRAEAAQLIYGLIDGAAASGAAEAVFSDVAATEPYYGAVQALYKMEVMGGYHDGTFCPQQSVTRAEFISALFRLSGQKSPGVPNYSDVTSTHWAAGAVAYAQKTGWVSGYADGKFYPDRALTRAEAAVILANMRGGLPEHRDVDAACGEEGVYADVPATHWAYYEIIDVSYTNELLDYVNGQVEGVQPGFMRLGGELCYINPDTLRIECFDQGFHAVEDQLYYVSHPGFFFEQFDEGLIEIDGSMFYVPEENGPFMADDSFGYLYFGPDGRYTSGDATVDEFVDDILSDILYDTSLTQSEKLFRAYCAIRDGGYNYRSVQAAWERGTTDWSLGCAKYMYKNKAGSCYYWASAFLYLARRLGYQAYPVCGGVGTGNQLHAWVVVIYDDGEEYICDVELEWAYIHNFYHVSFYTTDMYLQPLNATHATYVFPGDTVTHYQGGYVPESDEELFEVPEEEVPPTETPAATENPANTEQPVEPPATEQPIETAPPADTPTAPPAETTPPADTPTAPPAETTPPASDVPVDQPNAEQATEPTPVAQAAA